jgi:hypothetical protein
MAKANRLRRKLKQAWIIKKSRTLFRDPDFIFPRIIHKTKVRSKTVIWKRPGGEREKESRRILAEVTPKKGKRYYFQLSKRYPTTANRKRWEKYYDLPSAEDILNGRNNRRLKKLLTERRMTFEQLFDLCSKGYEEMEQLMLENLQLDGYEYNLDLGPDQYMVSIKNGKPLFILIDS